MLGKRLIILWVFILGILYSLLSILRHNHFESGGFDLGIYDQEIWQFSRFLYPYNTIKERFIFGDHLSLTLSLLAPLYYIWNDVRFLLIFQAFWISFSAFGIYLIAKNRKFSSFVSLALSISYSLFYGIQYGVFFDFHPVTLGIGFLVWTIYFFETTKKKLCIATLILLLLTQENMGIVLICLGCIYVFKKEKRKPALFFIALGILWSIIAAKIVASFSPVGFQYMPRIESNPVKIITDFFNSYEKQQVWMYTLLSFSFIPFLSLGTILAVFLDLSQYFITGDDFARMWSPYTHHRIFLGVFLLLGTLEVLVFLKKKKIEPYVVSLIILLSVLIQQYVFHFPLNKLSKQIYWKTEKWMDDNNRLIQQISPNESIASSQNLASHLSHRKEIYILYPKIHDFAKISPCGVTSCWWLDFAGKPNLLVVDLHPNQQITQLLETNEHFQSAVTNMKKAKKIILIKNIGDARMYKINY